MEPTKYLEFTKNDILANLTSPGMYSEEVAEEIYDLIIHFVNRFKAVRSSGSKTNEVLQEIEELREFKELRGYEDMKVGSIKHWLLKALYADDTFVYSYNLLAQFSNRKTETDSYPLKIIMPEDLFILLEEEIAKGDKYDMDSIFPTIFKLDQLKAIYSRSVKLKLIRSSEDDFLFWFYGGEINNPKQIKWQLKGKMNKPHKSALHWFGLQMNPKAEPSDINKVFNITIDSNNKGYKPTEEMKSIFNNL